MTKSIIWLVTIAGVLPVTLISFVVLINRMGWDKEHEQPPDSNVVEVLISSSLTIWPSDKKLNLCLQTWPAILAISGVVLMFVGMFFLLPSTQRRGSERSITQIAPQIERFFSSAKDVTSLTISTLNGENVVSMTKKGNKVWLFVVSQAGMENRIEQMLSSHGINRSHDQMLSTKQISDTKCMLEFPLAMDSKATADLIRTLFVNAFGADDSTDLRFSAETF